jgi:hypothetical protein
MNYKSGILIILLLFLTPLLGLSQVRVGDFSYSKNKLKKLNEKNLKRFTNTQTTFVFPNFFPKSSYENILGQVWDVTPYKVIYEDDFTGGDLKIDDALARFQSVEIEETTRLGMIKTYSYTFLDFNVVDKVKKKKKENTWSVSRVGAIYFTEGIKMRKQIALPSFAEEVDMDLINFRLGYLKNYLQLINEKLKNKKSIDIYDDYTLPELKNLKNHILYIDSNLLYGFNAFFVREKKSPEIEKLMKDYPFKYEVVDYKMLEEKIFSENNDFYYLMYNQINYNKIINIVNGRTGNVVYQEYTTMSYNIKPKDLKKISSKITKVQ